MKKQFNLPNLEEARKRTKDASQIIHDALVLDDTTENIGVGKTYFIRTYGCQANFHDTEIMSGILEKIGYTQSLDITNSDLVILNTCAIRENAEDKVIGEIGSLKKQKQENPRMIIAIGGCMMQQPTVISSLWNTYHQVDLIFGTHTMVQLPKMLAQIYADRQRFINVSSEQGKIYEDLPVHRANKYKAWVNIMDGCDKFCTYCIVPYTRGKQRSRLSEDILAEVKDLYIDGCQEITLLGQNVNAYGKDLANETDFAELLDKVAEIGIPRVRFMTSHPWDFSQQMCEVIGKRKNIMPYIHLPVQSGSDEVLRRMGRRYTANEYIKLLTNLREQKPQAAFSTDIIVGFPQESEEDFQATLDLVNTCQFDSAFTFAYSVRPGTPAEKFNDQIPEEIKKQRLARLNKVVAYWGHKNNERYLDKVVKVLVDGPSKKDKTVWSGYSEEMKLVNFIPTNAKIGQIVDVKITEVKSWTLDGKQV